MYGIWLSLSDGYKNYKSGLITEYSEGGEGIQNDPFLIWSIYAKTTY
jgi:hypothetical protein